MLIRSITLNATDKKFSIRQFPSPEHPYIAFPQKNLAVLDISRFTTGEIGPQSRLYGRVKLPTTIDRRRKAWMAFLSLSPNHCYVVCSLNTYCQRASRWGRLCPQLHCWNTRTTERHSLLCMYTFDVYSWQMNRSFKLIVSFLRWVSVVSIFQRITYVIITGHKHFIGSPSNRPDVSDPV